MIETQIVEPSSLGTSGAIVESHHRVPLWVKRLVAIRPITYVTMQTSGETLCVRYRLFGHSQSFARTQITEILSDPIIAPTGYPMPQPKMDRPQKLHTVMYSVIPDSIIDIEMNSLEPMTVAPRAGLELLYE